MKLSVGFAALSLFLAAAAALTEANSLYDVVSHKHHAAHAHVRDMANPGKHCEPASAAHRHALHHSSPNHDVEGTAANTSFGVLHVNPGPCSPVGATGTLS
jgi:hypothetical protein